MSFNYFEAEAHVATYNKFRPSPPESLVNRIVSFALEKIPGSLETALDVGCGSGQSTESLSSHFKKVFAFDPSESIILEAQKNTRNTNITYKKCGAELLDLPDNSVDLITAAQSVHWFDLPKFYTEAERVLRVNGVLAIYGYRLPCPVYNNLDDQLTEVIKKYYSEVLGKYVLAESRKVYLDHYTASEFNDIPFIENGRMIREEAFTTEVEAEIGDITGYVSSWSGFQNYRKLEGEEKAARTLKNFEYDMRDAMGLNVTGGEAAENLKIKFKYFLLMGRKDGTKSKII